MNAAWMGGARARAWATALAGAGALVLAALLLTSHGGADPLGRPVGSDFASFWTASRLALAHGGAAAYDAAAHRAEQEAAFPAAGEYFAFFYPPPFLLVCLWLGALPYLAALSTWLLAGFLLLLACIRRLLPREWPYRWAFLAVAAFPGVLQNALHGQNGFLSAACFAAAAVLASRSPFAAGACLGLLVCKPHLLLAAPIVLLAGRRWTILAGAACSGLGLLALSWAVLGTDAWAGFLANAPLARSTLEQGLVGPEKMQSAFAAVRLLGGGLVLGYAVQAGVALAALAAAASVIMRRPGEQAEMAILAVLAMLCSPFLLDYDLVCLAAPLAWMLAAAQPGGFLRFERPVLLAAYALPLLSRPLATYAVLPVGPAVLGLTLLILLRRVRRM